MALTYKQARELLDDAVSILEDVIDGEDVHAMASEWVNNYVKLTTRKRKGGWKLKEDVTRKYEKAKALVADGMAIGVACKKAKLTLDQWYRRKSIEVHGVSRINRNYYD